MIMIMIMKILNVLKKELSRFETHGKKTSENNYQVYTFQVEKTHELLSKMEQEKMDKIYKFQIDKRLTFGSDVNMNFEEDLFHNLEKFNQQKGIRIEISESCKVYKLPNHNEESTKIEDLIETQTNIFKRSNNNSIEDNREKKEGRSDKSQESVEKPPNGHMKTTVFVEATTLNSLEYTQSNSDVECEVENESVETEKGKLKEHEKQSIEDGMGDSGPIESRKEKDKMILSTEILIEDKSENDKVGDESERKESENDKEKSVGEEIRLQQLESENDKLKIFFDIESSRSQETEEESVIKRKSLKSEDETSKSFSNDADEVETIKEKFSTSVHSNQMNLMMPQKTICPKKMIYNPGKRLGFRRKRSTQGSVRTISLRRENSVLNEYMSNLE